MNSKKLLMIVLALWLSNAGAAQNSAVTWSTFGAGFAIPPKVGEALRERCGVDAPHDSTLKRWMVRDRWASRRQAIHEHTARLNDRLRAAEDTRLIASLTGLRETLVAAGAELPFRSAEGAVFALSALQKVIDRLSKAAAEESDCFSQEDLDMVMETLFQVLWEDEVVGAALDQRMSQLLDLIDSRLSRPEGSPTGKGSIRK